MFSTITVQRVLKDPTITAREVNNANNYLRSRLHYGETIQMGDVRKYIEEDRKNMQLIRSYRKARGVYGQR